MSDQDNKNINTNNQNSEDEINPDDFANNYFKNKPKSQNQGNSNRRGISELQRKNALNEIRNDLMLQNIDINKNKLLEDYLSLISDMENLAIENEIFKEVEKEELKAAKLARLQKELAEIYETIMLSQDVSEEIKRKIQLTHFLSQHNKAEEQNTTPTNKNLNTNKAQNTQIIENQPSSPLTSRNGTNEETGKDSSKIKDIDNQDEINDLFINEYKKLLSDLYNSENALTEGIISNAEKKKKMVEKVANMENRIEEYLQMLAQKGLLHTEDADNVRELLAGTKFSQHPTVKLPPAQLKEGLNNTKVNIDKKDSQNTDLDTLKKKDAATLSKIITNLSPEDNKEIEESLKDGDKKLIDQNNTGINTKRDSTPFTKINNQPTVIPKGNNNTESQSQGEATPTNNQSANNQQLSKNQAKTQAPKDNTKSEEEEKKKESPVEKAEDVVKEVAKSAIKELIFQIFFVPPVCFYTWVTILITGIVICFFMATSIVADCIINLKVFESQCTSLTTAIADDVKKSVLSSLGLSGAELDERMSNKKTEPTKTPTEQAQNNSGVPNPSQ